jgi:hypothetical protein
LLSGENILENISIAREVECQDRAVVGRMKDKDEG